GQLVRDFWWLAPLLVLAGVALLRFAVLHNRRMVEEFSIAAPVFGPMLLLSEHGRYLRSLATLLEGGMPLADAMPLAREAVNMAVLRAELEKAEERIRLGERAPMAFRRHSRLAKELLSYIEIGD